MAAGLPWSVARPTRHISRDWYVQERPEHIDLRAPGIYRWRIVQPNGVDDRYVGRATKLRSRMRAYSGNVHRMIHGLPYRNGGDFRPVHHVLRMAYQLQWDVVCTPLENCTKDDLATRERHWIDALKATLNGPAGRIRWAEIQKAVGG